MRGITVYYTCPMCEEEIEVTVVINEEDDLPEACPSCQHPIPDDVHEKMQVAAMEQATDTASDYRYDD